MFMNLHPVLVIWFLFIVYFSFHCIILFSFIIFTFSGSDHYPGLLNLIQDAFFSMWGHPDWNLGLTREYTKPDEAGYK